MDCRCLKWISVKNKYPKEGKAVLFTDGEQVLRGSYFGYDPGYRWYPDGFHQSLSNKITHWMPLPDAPDHVRDAKKMVDNITRDHERKNFHSTNDY